MVFQLYQFFLKMAIDAKVNSRSSEIQHQHLATRLPDLVEAYGYSYTVLNNTDMDIAINQILECEKTNKICLLKKETFFPMMYTLSIFFLTF